MGTRTIVRLAAQRITAPDIEALGRIERTLHRWAEDECNGDIERDEVTGRPYRDCRNYSFGSTIIPFRRAVADRERGALARLAGIMARYPALQAYHQSDPRGCALWILPASLTEPERHYTDGISV